MMKSSIASLQERLADWVDWDGAAYQVGACLGLWPEFGAPYNEDCWHGVKGIMWSSQGDFIYHFLDGLVKAGYLERREEPDIGYRWNPAKE
jgi:hypothetical protein